MVTAPPNPRSSQGHAHSSRDRSLVPVGMATILPHAAKQVRYLEARLLAVRACLERGEGAAAVAHAESLLGEHPHYPDLHFWLGMARFRAGDLAGAAVALEEAVSLHRQFARAHRLLGMVYHALGRHAHPI